MKSFWILLILLMTPLTGQAADTVNTAPGGNTFLALSYHDIRDALPAGREPDRLAVSTRNLIAQFSWLRENGFHPVDFDAILAARQGRTPLPKNAILLTFDDGFESLYSRVFPLLRLFGFPAVFAVTGRWIETPPGERVSYGGTPLPRDDFLDWDQVREMSRSGLVEFASHSFDLHRFIPSNPQGNRRPAAATRRYNEKSGRYEDRASYQKRVERDIRQMSDVMKKETGKAPRIMVWPYGLDNEDARSAAAKAGMEYGMILGGCFNRVDELSRICRILVEKNPPLPDFIWNLRNPGARRDPIRVVHVDLDYVFDEDPAQQKRNLDALLDRVKELRINTVYLQAFADPDGDGSAEALYFPNRHLPLRADLFSRVATQLRNRAGVQVFAWMPTLAFELPEGSPSDLRVSRWHRKDDSAPDRSRYSRLSPFHPEARRIIGEIYEDLALYTPLDGVLFHDDGFLTDYEDAGRHAQKVYVERWGLPDTIQKIRKDPVAFQTWSKKKTTYLADFTHALLNKVRRFRPDILSARNLYAVTVLDPLSEAWLAQSYADALMRYDQVALLAMPYLEGADRPDAWLENLARTVAQYPGGTGKTVFELQSFRWREGRRVPSPRLREQMQLLQRLGAVNFGYYPDDFVRNHPDLTVIRPVFSLEDNPFRP